MDGTVAATAVTEAPVLPSVRRHGAKGVLAAVVTAGIIFALQPASRRS